MACPSQDKCSLRKSVGMTAALRVWESFYCDGSHARCERQKLYASDRKVPDRLLPNGRLVDVGEGMATPQSRTEKAA
jgi:hypothetical protein